MADGKTAQKSSKETLIKIHYHRCDGDYTDAGLWIWDGTGENRFQPQEIYAQKEDRFGVTFHLSKKTVQTGHTDTVNEVGFVPRIRKSWSFKDGHDRHWHPGLGKEIWLIEDDPEIHTQPPHVNPCLRCAFLDDMDRILITLTFPVEQKRLKTHDVSIIGPNGKLPISHLDFLGQISTSVRTLEVHLKHPVSKINEPLRAEIAGYNPVDVLPRGAMFLPGAFETNEPLGAISSPQSTSFRVFSPPARTIDVVITSDSDGRNDRRIVELAEKDNGVWEGTADGDLHGHYYKLRVTTTAKQTPVEVIDPCALCRTGDQAQIINLRQTNPKGIARPTLPSFLPPNATDAIIYEMHVRDFTVSQNAGVQQAGKYLGFVEEGSQLANTGDDTVMTGISHLRELGVTHVQLLPVQSFDSSKGKYFWGYMTSFFNSPEASYASNGQALDGITELKSLIHRLHEAGIGVILDVVYNHTGEENTFEQVTPNYYHRLRDNGHFHNGSGCGNEFHSESPMGRRFIVDSCKYWVEEYGVDGFRFDLMGLVDIETMKVVRDEIRAINPRALIYGEPWTGGESGLRHITNKWAVRGTGIGAYNDHYRNALKGEPDGYTAGYVQRGDFRDGVIAGICGSIDDWTVNPADSINYATCHDNLTLWDKLELSSEEPEEERVKMQMLTFGILAVSQGILFLHGGAEMCRTKQGDANSYQSGDDINGLDWERKKTYRKVFEYHKNMIALRKSHPIFRLNSADDVRTRIHFHHENLPAQSAIVFTLNGDGIEGEDWAEVVILINPSADTKDFVLPLAGKMNVFVQGEKIDLEGKQQCDGKVTVPGRSIVLVAR